MLGIFPSPAAPAPHGGLASPGTNSPGPVPALPLNLLCPFSVLAVKWLSTCLLGYLRTQCQGSQEVNLNLLAHCTSYWLLELGLSVARF